MQITRGKRLAVRTDFRNEHKYPKSPFETLKLFDDRKIEILLQTQIAKNEKLFQCSNSFGIIVALYHNHGS